MAENLPEEVITFIFSYLTLTDKLQANLVCKRWHWAFCDPRLHENTQIAFTSDELLLSSLMEPNSLLESDLPSAIKKIHFQKLEASIFSLRPLNEWVGLLSRLSSLAIIEANIVSETELVLLLKQCKALTSLSLINARDVMISGGLLSDEKDRIEVHNSLIHVNSLDLSSNSPYLSDLLFNRISDCTPNVEHLTLAYTNILSHSQVYKKYYPESVKQNNSPSVLTLRNITRFINERRLKLKSLNFYNSNISSLGLKEIGSIAGLDLKRISVGKCHDINQASMLQFCRDQQNIEHLNIDYCRKILVDNPASCLSLFEAWSRKLKHLSMKGLSSPSGMKDCFEQLDHLESLTVAECDVPSVHIIDGLKSNKGLKNNLSYLNMNSLGISASESLVALCPVLLNLVHLELRNEHSGVNDIVLQNITKNCTRLSVLVLNNCTQLSDFGFIGFISNLKGLTRLELEKLRITEMCLIESFQFDHLRTINLSICKSIGDVGFRHLVDKNQSIERFMVKQCNISGETLVHVAKICKRLEVLDLEGCQLVTNEALKELPNYCSHLKQLDVSFCKYIKTTSLQELKLKMKHLRSIEMRGLAIAELLNEYEDDNIPMPPPPP